MNSKFRRKSGSINDTRIAGLYDLEHTIGKGHFAVVKLARHVFTGEKVAVKVIDKTKMQEDTRKYMMQEVRCMKLVQHPNIVRLYEVIDTQTKLFLILELGDYDMYDYIMKNLDKGCKESDAQQYFSQIIKAIDYCHTLHVVHRDLKLENVVFFEKLGMVKLTDFGFSNLYTPGQQLNTSCGSLAYSAPEILLGDAYDPTAVDIWSLGVILYMLVCGRLPFQEANESETLTKILDCRFTLPDHLSTPCKHLISRILVRDPKKRATISEIIQSSWVIAGDRGFAEVLPLIVKDHLPDSAHSTIIEQMIAGGIGEEEEILKAIENDDYSYITATYYLLAERVLASYREEQANRLLCAIQTPSDEKEIFDNEHNFSCTATVSGGFQTRSRSNSWRGASSKRAFTILKEESEEELSSYLRSSSRQSSRNSSPSVSMFGGLHSSRDRISPQAIQELLEFSRTSGIRRAASPDSRFSSRSPSPPTSSGRTSPAFSGIVSGIARLKSSMITSTSGMRKLSSSPHLLGICEESEDLTDSNASPFYANTSKSGFQKSSPSSKGHLTRNNRSASTGFPSSVTARLQKMSTITNNDVFDNPSTSTATSSRSNSITSLQTYGSARVVRPRQAVVSPDMCRRYEQHQRFVTRSRKSTSCSSSETSDDDTNERKWSLIGSKYCKRNPDDPKPDEDPPKGGTGGGNFHGSLSVKMTIPESETNGNHEQESTTNADNSNNGTKSNKNGNMNRWDSLELLDSCSTYGRYSGVLQPILEHPPDSLLYDRAAFIRCRMFNKSETAREALHDWLQESQVFNDYEVEEYDNYRDKFVNNSPPKFGHMKRASLNPSASSPFYRSLTRSRSLDSTFRSMHDSISNGSRSLMDSRSDSICLDLSDKEDMQISMISDSSSTTIDSGCSSDDEPDQTGITIKFPMNYSPSSLKKPKIDFQENIYKVCQ